MRKAIILQSVLLTSLIVASPICAQSADVTKIRCTRKKTSTTNY